MDPRTIELSNLRLLDDCLNQTIEVLLCGPRGGISPHAWGVGSPYAQQPFAQHAWGVPFGAGVPGAAWRGGYPGQLGWSPWGVSPIAIARHQAAMYARPFGTSPY